MVLVAASKASARVVFPAPEWPTSTTFRTFSGWPAAGALPAAPDVAFSAIPPPPGVHVQLLLVPAFTHRPWHHNPPAAIGAPVVVCGSRRGRHVKRIDQPPVRSKGHAQGAETWPCPAADTGGAGARAHPADPEHADGHRDRRHDGRRAEPVPHRTPFRRDPGVH